MTLAKTSRWSSNRRESQRLHHVTAPRADEAQACFAPGKAPVRISTRCFSRLAADQPDVMV
jgi:hypothetical protein